MAARVRAPGYYRAAVFMVGAVAFSFFLTWVVRASTGHTTFPPLHLRRRDPDRRAARGAARVPGRDRRLRLLVLLGGRPQDAARGPLGPRRLLVEGLLPHQHTDHKVIGIQYTVNSFIFLLIGGADRDADAGSARAAGRALRGRQHLQRAVLGARHDPDLPVHHPGVRGLGNFVIPLMIGPRHGLPAAERALVLAACRSRGS